MREGRQRRSRGVALLTAMLVVTIATMLAANMMWESGVDLQRTENLLLQDQARMFALAAESGAMELLAEDARRQGANSTDDFDDAWALVSRQPPFAIEGGEVTLVIEDATGRFNVNNLVDMATGDVRPAWRDQFRNLLLVLPTEEPVDPAVADKIVDAAVDWIDPNTVPEDNGAEDDVYTSRLPPYRPANFWFVSASELLAVDGMTSEIWEQLRHHVTALPPETEASTLNVNTATPVVLASLVPGRHPETVKDFAGGTYTDYLDLLTDLQIVNDIDQNLSQRLAVSSDWFEVTVTVSIGTTRARLYSLLERRGQSVRVRLRTYDAK